MFGEFWTRKAWKKMYKNLSVTTTTEQQWITDVRFNDFKGLSKSRLAAGPPGSPRSPGSPGAPEHDDHAGHPDGREHGDHRDQENTNIKRKDKMKNEAKK